LTRIHIRTFLANSSRDSVQNVQRFARYGLPGSKGHNYFWSSDKAIRGMAIGGEVYDQVVHHATNIDKLDERETNENIIKMFHQWWVGHKAEGFIPPTSWIDGPKGILSVGIYPTFALMTKPQKEVVLTFAGKKPLPKRIAGLGVYMMKKALDPDGILGLKFVVHDLTKGIRHCEGSIPKHAETILQIELARQEEAYLVTNAA
jgi:hypothetical protein